MKLISVINLKWMLAAEPVHESGLFVEGAIVFVLSDTQGTNSAKISELLKG
jgi:hypothetical protein